MADFKTVLAAAVEDMVENGFDSQARVQRWMDELRAAARDSMVSPTALEQQLRDALAATYRKLVERGEIARYVPGVARFTIDLVQPQLRAELDRRILASANLIRLNRTEAIEKTLRRFQGWSTSIPAGGTDVARKAETKRDVRKALTQLPFEERRVAIDQGHKLTASLSKIVASGGGAIAGRWRSHWRQAGYDYREPHKERDEKVYLLRGTWAVDAGLVKPGKAGWYEDVTAVAEEPFCRCWMVWMFALRDLPADMLTRKGKAALAEARSAAA